MAASEFGGLPHFVTPDLGAYLAGLTDGEGHFGIGARNVNSFYCFFLIHLRADDRELLEELASETGLGRINIGRREQSGRRHPSFRWVVSRRDQCLAIVDLFEACPLRSRKRHVFEVWADAVHAWRREDWRTMASDRDEIMRLRAFDAQPAFVEADAA
jgi:hypothetical protein